MHRLTRCVLAAAAARHPYAAFFILAFTTVNKIKLHKQLRIHNTCPVPCELKKKIALNTPHMNATAYKYAMSHILFDERKKLIEAIMTL